MFKKEKGITLIALIITIIVMLILVGVTINVALSGGLFTKASEASKQMQIEADRETLLSAVVAAIGYDGKVDLGEIELPTGWTGTDGTYTSPKGNIFTVDEDGEIEKTQDGNEESKYKLVYNKNYKASLTDCGMPGYDLIYCFEENPNILVCAFLQNTYSELTHIPQYYTVDFENGEFYIQTDKVDLFGLTSGKIGEDGLTLEINFNGTKVICTIEDECIFDLYNPTVSDITNEESKYYSFKNGFYKCDYGYVYLEINTEKMEIKSEMATTNGYLENPDDNNITEKLKEYNISFDENRKLWYTDAEGQTVELIYVESF